MKKLLLPFFLLALLVQTTYGQYKALDAQFSDYQVVQISSQQLMQAIQHARGEVVSLQILGHRVQIYPSGIVSPQYKSIVQEARGQRELDLNTALPMRGSSRDGGKVSLTFNDNFVYGYITEGDEMFYIEPIYHFEKGQYTDTYVYYNTKDIKEDAPKTCGVDEMHEKARELVRSNVGRAGDCYEVEYAIANDWLMFDKYGSVAAVENHAIGVTNDMQTNYDNDFADELQFIIVEQFTSTCNTCDPWTASTNAGTLLNSFTGWGPNGFSASHDVGSLWTDRDFNGSTIGIAWLGSICTSLRYNCLQDFTNNANLKRVLVSHEIGHNFDANHDGGGGLIMSPSVSNTNTWSAQSISDIENFILSRWCLATCSSSSAPVADFDYTYISQCVPGQVQFNDLSSGTITAWDWDFPGGTPSSSTQQNPLIDYNTPGLYDVTLTVYNGNLSNSLTLPNAIEILALPVADFTFTINSREVTFNNSSQNANNFIWNFGDGNSSNESDPIYTYADDGIYVVSLFATNACTTDIFTFEVVIATPPTADFTSNPTEACEPGVINFMSLASNNTVDFFWEFEGGIPASSTDENPIVLYENPGNWDVKLTVSNPQGIDAVEIVDFITIHAQPDPSFTFTTSGTEVTFTNGSSNADAYLWEFGDGDTSTAVNPVHDYGMDGTFIVNLKALSNNCPDKTFTDTVTITLLPQAAFNVPGGTTGCTVFDAQFMDGSNNNPTSWMWSFEGGNPATSTDQNPLVSYTTIGSYDVELIVSNNLGSDTLKMPDYIQVRDIPVTNFSSDQDESVVVFNDLSFDADTYFWEFGDGATSDVASPIHDYMVEGTWNAVLTTTNICGSSSLDATITTVLSPIAGMTFSPSVLCEGESVQFSDDSENTVDQYQWSFEGGSPAASNEQNPSVTYSEDGTYDVTLIVINSEGSDTLILTNAVTVLQAPVAVINSTVTDNLIENSFTGNSYDLPLWLLPDGTEVNGSSASYTADSNGTYLITLIVTNDCGVDTAEIEQTINVYPEANISADLMSGCVELTVQLSAGDVPGGNYEWSIPGGTPSTSTEQNPIITFSERGLYDVSLTVSNAFGSASETMVGYIEVEDVPTSVFSANYDGIVLTTTNTSEFADSYLWDFGDGNTSTEFEPEHQFQENGTYTVTLTTQNECGSTSSETTLDVVVLVPSIAVSASTNSGCLPLEVIFTDMSGNDPTEWNWTFEGGTPAASTDQNPVVVYDAPGIFDVTVTMTNAAGSSTKTYKDFITVESKPISSFSFTAMDGNLSFENQTQYGENFTWDFGDGGNSDEENPNHEYTASGDYDVMLIASNECGSDTFIQTITVVVSSVSTPAYVTSFNAYPNPVNENLRIVAVFTQQLSGQIALIDQLGRMVYLESFEPTQHLDRAISFDELVSGMYVLRIQTESGPISRKIIKR